MFPRGSIVLIWLTPRPRGRGETSFHGSWMECGPQTAGCVPGRALSRGEAKWIRCGCGLLIFHLGGHNPQLHTFSPHPVITCFRQNAAQVSWTFSTRKRRPKKTKRSWNEEVLPLLGFFLGGAEAKNEWLEIDVEVSSKRGDLFISLSWELKVFNMTSLSRGKPRVSKFGVLEFSHKSDGDGKL